MQNSRAALPVFVALLNETNGLWLARRLHDAFYDGPFSDSDGFAGDRSRNSRSLRDLDFPAGDYVAFDMARDYDIVSPDCALPVAITCKRHGTVDVAIAVDFTADLIVSLT